MAEKKIKKDKELENQIRGYYPLWLIAVFYFSCCFFSVTMTLLVAVRSSKYPSSN